MTGSTFVMLSFGISHGLPLAFAVRELLITRKPPRGGDEPPPEPELPRAPKPLPECLLPRPTAPAAPRRVRVLEDA